MPPIDRYYAACCQTNFPCIRHRDELPGRVKKCVEFVDRAVLGYSPFFDVKLAVFPEFVHAAPIYETAAELADKLAVELPNDYTEIYARTAKRHGCHIVAGTFLEVDRAHPGHVFNTACLIGPDGIVMKYRKVQPWVPWEVHTSPADLTSDPKTLFPVADTEIGRIGIAICYDWLFPEVLRGLAANGADVLVRTSAYMDPWGATPPMDWWTLFNRARAVENLCHVVACNQAAALENYPPFSWPGGSMIVDYDGRIMTQADPGPGEKIVVGPVDLAALRAERARRRGHQMLFHRFESFYNREDKAK